MSTDGYFRIRISTLKAEEPVPFPVYIYLDKKVIPYLKAGDQIESKKIISLHQKDTGDSFIVANQDKQKYRDYIKNLMNSDHLSHAEKGLLLKESSIALLEDLFENPDVGQALEEAKPIIRNLMDFMKISPESIHNLITLSGHDFYTYNHSFDVTIYSLGLGQILGYDQKTMEELGQASLFHDIGKRLIPLEILCKNGPLSDAEWVQMRKHPQYGLKILNENTGISDGIKAACYEHHESWTGGGYPQGISGEEIHPFARIVALTDTYDAMTTQRSYNVPMKPFDALNLMNGNIAKRFDPKMLKAFYSVLFKLKSVG